MGLERPAPPSSAPRPEQGGLEGILDDATGKNAPAQTKPTHPVAPNSADAPPLPVANNVVPTDSSGRPTRPPKKGLTGILDSAEGHDPPAPPPAPIPPPAEKPKPVKPVPASTVTDLDKVDVYRRVQAGDPTVRRVDGQVTRDWIADGLAKGNPAVIGLFSQQELNDAGYGHTALDQVVDDLLDTPVSSKAPPSLLPVPGTRVVDPPPPAPRPRGWVEDYLDPPPKPKAAPPAARDVARLPVPISGPVRTGPAQLKAPVTAEQRTRLL